MKCDINVQIDKALLRYSPPIPSSEASDGYRGAATTFLKLIKVARGETVGWQEGDFLVHKILFRKIASRVSRQKTQTQREMKHTDAKITSTSEEK